MREQVLYSLLVGLAVSSAIALPLVVWHYRRFGRVSAARMALVGAAVTYGAGVVAFTMFPLPDLTPAWCEAFAASDPVLRPFTFVSDIRRDTAGMSLVATLTSTAVMQVVLNVVLFVPFGILGRLLFEWSRTTTVVAAAMASLAIELTQYTAVWGIFPCAYRIADVDDLMLNTSGAVLGVAVAGVGLRLVPTRERLAAGRGVPRRVTVWRRWIGMIVDLSAVGFVYASTVVAVHLVLDVLGADSDGFVVGNLVACFVAGAVVVVPALMGSGASFGQRAVWLQPTWANPPGAARRLVRALAVPGGCAVLVVVGAAPLAVLWLFAAVGSVALTRDGRGLSGVLTGSEIVDARAAFEITATTVEKSAVPSEDASLRSRHG
ncbi:glycopeptide antibiotics resistance protein [Rhodococcus sp. LBL1]|nr:glycopeptide antibiotics resistance protein [Rhodococcus sp. LBL1]MDH6682280.1 glycopeptide antibiotics resistance protein [Rhodococcus sp. LBL2]